MDQYLSVILGLEPNQSYAAMLGLVVQFCTAQKETDIIKRHKVKLLYSCFVLTFFWGGKWVISSIAFCHEEAEFHYLVSLSIDSVGMHIWVKQWNGFIKEVPDL